MVEFPIYYPTLLAPDSQFADDSRAFPIDGPGDDVYYGYKLAVSMPGVSFPTAYYGVSGTNWADPPILANPSEERDIDGRHYLLFFDGGRLRLVGWQTSKASYWVTNTLDPAARRGPDARDRAVASRVRLMGDEPRTIGVIGVGWVGLVTAACFAELGHHVIAVDIDETKVERLRSGAVTIHEPGLEELLARNRERLRVHDRHRRGARRLAAPVLLRRHPPDVLRRRRPLAGPRRRRQARPRTAVTPW